MNSTAVGVSAAHIMPYVTKKKEKATKLGNQPTVLLSLSKFLHSANQKLRHARDPSNQSGTTDWTMTGSLAHTPQQRLRVMKKYKEDQTVLLVLTYMLFSEGFQLILIHSGFFFVLKTCQPHNDEFKVQKQQGSISPSRFNKLWV